jgi:hypothetical protein
MARDARNSAEAGAPREAAGREEQRVTIWRQSDCMIHQLIFANPKPGMTVEEFQDYWVDVHAQKYAKNIRQILRYKVSRVVAACGEVPSYHGIAEIWLENEREQLLSLESDEFIRGARANEPEWAAFWESVCLDTYTTAFIKQPEHCGTKLLLLCKRRGGVPLKVFRSFALQSLSAKALGIEGAVGLEIDIVKDSAYGFGETIADAAFQVWFEDLAPLKNALSAHKFSDFYSSLQDSCEPQYIHKFACTENIIIP